MAEPDFIPVHATPDFIPVGAAHQGSETKETPGLLERADSAITSALEPNPRNYQSLLRTNAIEVPKTLGREVYSGAKSILGMPGAAYHAFADEPTEEETREAGGPEQVSGMKRIGLGIGRMAVKPVLNAVEDYAGGKVTPEAALSVAPEAIGQGAGTVIGGKATEIGGAKLASAADNAVRTIGPPIVRGAVKTANAGIKRAPVVAGSALGHVVGKELGLPAVGASVGAAVGSQFPLKFRIPGEDFGLPKPVYPGAPFPEDAPTGEFVDSPKVAAPQPPKEPPFAEAHVVNRPEPAPYRKVGGIEPEDVNAPDANVLGGRRGVRVARPAAPSAPRLLTAGEAAPKEEPAAAVAAPSAKPDTSPRRLGDLLNEGLGGKPLEKGVSLRNQAKPLTNLQKQITDSAEPLKAAPRAPLTNLQKQIADSAHPLPEGFTPVESSVIKGYKYDPAKQQLSAITNAGQRYTHAEVTPEEFKEFEAAKSKGTAWNKQIRANHVQVEKNGEPTKPIAPHSATPDDLTPEWTRALDDVKAKKTPRIAKPN